MSFNQRVQMPAYVSNDSFHVKWDPDFTRVTVVNTLNSKYMPSDYARKKLPITGAAPVMRQNYPFPACLSEDWMALVSGERKSAIYREAQTNANVSDKKWQDHVKRAGVARSVLYDGLSAIERADIKAKLKLNSEWEKANGFVWFDKETLLMHPPPVPNRNPGYHGDDGPAQKEWAGDHMAQCTLNRKRRYAQIQPMIQSNQYPVRSYIHRS